MDNTRKNNTNAPESDVHSSQSDEVDRTSESDLNDGASDFQSALANSLARSRAMATNSPRFEMESLNLLSLQVHQEVCRNLSAYPLANSMVRANAVNIALGLPYGDPLRTEISEWLDANHPANPAVALAYANANYYGSDDEEDDWPEDSDAFDDSDEENFWAQRVRCFPKGEEYPSPDSGSVISSEDENEPGNWESRIARMRQERRIANGNVEHNLLWLTGQARWDWDIERLRAVRDLGLQCLEFIWDAAAEDEWQLIDFHYERSLLSMLSHFNNEATLRLASYLFDAKLVPGKVALCAVVDPSFLVEVHRHSMTAPADAEYEIPQSFLHFEEWQQPCEISTLEARKKYFGMHPFYIHNANTSQVNDDFKPMYALLEASEHLQMGLFVCEDIHWMLGEQWALWVFNAAGATLFFGTGELGADRKFHICSTVLVLRHFGDAAALAENRNRLMHAINGNTSVEEPAVEHETIVLEDDVPNLQTMVIRDPNQRYACAHPNCSKPAVWTNATEDSFVCTQHKSLYADIPHPTRILAERHRRCPCGVIASYGDPNTRLRLRCAHCKLQTDVNITARGRLNRRRADNARRFVGPVFQPVPVRSAPIVAVPVPRTEADEATQPEEVVPRFPEVRVHMTAAKLAIQSGLQDTLVDQASLNTVLSSHVHSERGTIRIRSVPGADPSATVDTVARAFDNAIHFDFAEMQNRMVQTVALNGLVARLSDARLHFARLDSNFLVKHCSCQFWLMRQHILMSTNEPSSYAFPECMIRFEDQHEVFRTLTDAQRVALAYGMPPKILELASAAEINDAPVNGFIFMYPRVTDSSGYSLIAKMLTISGRNSWTLVQNTINALASRAATVYADYLGPVLIFVGDSRGGTVIHGHSVLMPGSMRGAHSRILIPTRSMFVIASFNDLTVSNAHLNDIRAAFSSMEQIADPDFV